MAGPDSGFIYRVDPQGGFSVIAGSGDWKTPADGTLAKSVPSGIEAVSPWIAAARCTRNGDQQDLSRRGDRLRHQGGGQWPHADQR